MAVTANSAVTPQTPKNCWANFIQGTDAAGTWKTLYIAGANGSKVFGIVGVTNDGTAHAASLRLNAGGTTALAPFVTQTVSINAGNASGTIGQALLTTTQIGGLGIDQNGNLFLALAASDTLQATYATTLGSSSTLSVFGIAADF